jgi:hypothetical protein
MAAVSKGANSGAVSIDSNAASGSTATTSRSRMVQADSRGAPYSIFSIFVVFSLGPVF